jgi:hypothetical protein
VTNWLTCSECGTTLRGHYVRRTPAGWTHAHPCTHTTPDVDRDLIRNVLDAINYGRSAEWIAREYAMPIAAVEHLGRDNGLTSPEALTGGTWERRGLTWAWVPDMQREDAA